ncbi:MAG: hypothetical protein QXS20_09670 [Candidatus Thorarchaeota archaeon]
MRKIDEMVPDLGLLKSVLVVMAIAVVLELTGVWATMVLAGGVGALFVRSGKRAFLVGLAGVGAAWTLIFAYLIVFAQALEIADFFAGLMGAVGMGGIIIGMSILLGGLVGGCGGFLGRSMIELVDALVDRHQGPAPA